MSSLIMKFEEKEFKYEVHYSELPVEGTFDYGGEAANAEYLKRFEDEELFNLDVFKYKRCDCCNQWKIVDSIGGFHCESVEEALKCFKEHCGV